MPETVVLEEFTAKRPREGAGSRSANRFSYQVDWAFSKLIELHRTNQNYLIVLDLHDDVVIADSETAPTRLDFFQVKTTTDEPWDEKKLLRRSKGGLSVAGKLYLNRVNFPQHARLLGFVSNLPVDLSVQDEFVGKPEIFVGQLRPACKKRFLAHLRQSHSLADAPACDDTFQFVISNLNVHGHSTDVMGLLGDYVDTIHQNYPAPTLYRTIGDLMRRRNDREILPTTVPELLARKAIGRSEVQAIVDRWTPLGRYTELWTSILPDLQDGLDMTTRKRLKAAWNRYAVERQNGANDLLQQLRDRIVIRVKQVMAEVTIRSPVELFDVIIPKLDLVPRPYEGDYLRAAILLEWYDDGDDTVSPSNTEPSAGAA